MRDQAGIVGMRRKGPEGRQRRKEAVVVRTRQRGKTGRSQDATEGDLFE